jgi:hypothetical protein
MASIARSARIGLGGWGEPLRGGHRHAQVKGQAEALLYRPLSTEPVSALTAGKEHGRRAATMHR